MLENFPELTIIHNEVGYLNGTRLCEGVFLRIQDYCRLRSTKELATYLGELHGIPEYEIIQTVISGQANLKTVWIHPDLAVNLLSWCSPRFAVAINSNVI